MLKINDKTFLNIQEAVQWLMDNNALPFQCTANYAANTEIGLGTIVNPTMAKVRIGSLIFFADSKVSTVIGVTSNGFIVSDQYNDLVDDVVYVSNVQLNASGHLIVTLSNGNQIDAGLVKQVASFSINGSQHLIATYNDGSTNDLGAIFNGNISISGNISATGTISAGGNISTSGNISGKTPVLTCDEAEISAQKPVVEVMTGYSFYGNASIVSPAYAGVVKNGNKITFSIAGSIATEGTLPGSGEIVLGYFSMPLAIGSKLIPISGIRLAAVGVMLVRNLYSAPTSSVALVNKDSGTSLRISILTNTLSVSTSYEFRFEITFLLSENLAA